MLDALLFSKTPAWLKVLYPDCLWNKERDSKSLYLTFDDGPIPEVTHQVLDELKKWNAKATFFCIGKNAEAHPKILRRIIEENHAVGNHTFDHLNGWQTDDKMYFQNIEKCTEVLNAIIGSSVSKLFRPPYGKLKPAQYRHIKKQYLPVMWDVLSFDFDKKLSKELVWNTVLKNTEPGSIIVFHDSLKAQTNMTYALPQVLKHFSKQGFKFDALC